MIPNNPSSLFRVRLVVAILLVVTSLLMARLLAQWAINPLKGIAELEPLIGLILFWPLSQVLIRLTSLWLGVALALIPAVSLSLIRVFAVSPNLAFGAYVFLGLLSLTVYLLFRHPPHRSPNQG